MDLRFASFKSFRCLFMAVSLGVRLEATSFDMVTIWRQWQHGRWSLLEDLPDSLPGDAPRTAAARRGVLEVYIEGQSLEFLRLELGEEPAGRGAS